jgi:hypothetical protein
MKNLTTIICRTLAMLLRNVGISWSADLQKGFAVYESGAYATALRERTLLAEQGYANAPSNLGGLERVIKCQNM